MSSADFDQETNLLEQILMYREHRRTSFEWVQTYNRWVWTGWRWCPCENSGQSLAELDIDRIRTRCIIMSGNVLNKLLSHH